VQKGNTTKQGLKRNIIIGSKNGVETFHTYLRFDLASVEKAKDFIESAELLLTFVGKKMEKPGSEVRVLGVALGDKELWPEKDIYWKESISVKSTDHLPLLAEVKVSPELITSFEGRRILRISTPELARFAAEGGDTITLLMTAITPDNDPMRFVSRENSAGKPPTLRVQSPRNPPENKSGKKGKR
jgi:hypothetical protein